MIISHYCSTQEDALRRAKHVARYPGYDYWGITMPDGRKGFAIYKDGNLIEKYLVIRPRV